MDAGIDDFAAEPQAVPRAIDMSDLLARSVSIRWDEAVAVVQELIDVLTSGGGDNPPVPDVNDIVIDDSGAVTAKRLGRGERGPIAAARVLHALLSSGDVPVPLRLFVTQANAPETHASLQEFAKGLAYFGRPGRAEMIRALYHRYATSSGNAAPASRPSPQPPPPRETNPSPFEAPRRRRPRWLLPVTITACVASLGAVIWFGVLRGDSGQPSQLVSETAKAIVAVGNTVKGAIDSATAAPAIPAPQAKAVNTAAPERAAQPRRQASTSTVTREKGVGTPSASFTTPVIADLLHTLRTPSGPSEPGESATSTPNEPEPAVEPSSGAEALAAIYSHEDVNVQPPVMMYPQLPPPFMVSSAGTGVVNRMELVVAADGSVERVRLVNGPTRMPDMMLLSGAKLWKFTPAFKNGEPVRYRTMVTWSGFP